MFCSVHKKGDVCFNVVADFVAAAAAGVPVIHNCLPSHIRRRYAALMWAQNRYLFSCAMAVTGRVRV